MTRSITPRWLLSAGTLCAAVSLLPMISAFAQTSPPPGNSAGQDRTVPAPKAEQAPVAGETNPAKHDGSDRGDNALSQSAAEADPKARLQSDVSFLTEAGASGMAEIAASKLAVTKASDPNVKGFAKTLVTDHERMAAKLKTLAAQKKATLADKLDSKRQAVIDNLAKLSGKDFDKAYLEQMVNDHQETIAFFEERAKDTHDADLKAFITQALPTLREHSANAKTLYGVAPSK